MSCRGHGCEGRSILAAPPHSSALYVQRPCLRAHTVELDGLWQQWYERQVAGFELIRAQTKTGQAAQQSWELLQRAKDVQNLSEWQKEAIEKAMLELEDLLTLNLFNDTMRKYSGLLLGHPNKQEVRLDAFSTYECGSHIHAPRVPLYEGQNEVAQSDGFVKNINDLCGFVSPRVEQSPDSRAQRR
ncbi:hypothetical protein M438DRAFT_333656 [Aureobasidium pullulans EXF-150]|uniref:Uncharacterized protein n=1 Tax=Aureobasidium pullulans EXF-150 TaxID=1043002 RepID=A0A074XJM5_AURPU|nr:uncharacterized protein M438DRAFT_333656 [Aureobasidium pullulans EXF-150]KEQ85693.1 hypothetical protein M438DRAFT_333656 [Aureobasidium pullulans EXF-150]